MKGKIRLIIGIVLSCLFGMSAGFGYAKVFINRYVRHNTFSFKVIGLIMCNVLYWLNYLALYILVYLMLNEGIMKDMDFALCSFLPSALLFLLFFTARVARFDRALQKLEG